MRVQDTGVRIQNKFKALMSKVRVTINKVTVQENDDSISGVEKSPLYGGIDLILILGCGFDF
jgi:hypothetical protein